MLQFLHSWFGKVMLYCRVLKTVTLLTSETSYKYKDSRTLRDKGAAKCNTPERIPPRF